MIQLKAIVKICGAIFFTLSVYSVYVIGYLGLSVFRVRTIPWKNRCLTFWGRAVAFCLSIKIKVVGEKPEPPFFLVSNHLSYVDIIVLFATLKTTFVAKEEVRKWPVLGFISQTIGILFIKRTVKRDVKRVNNHIAKAIKQGHGVTVFPEGTTSPGEKVLRFRASLLEIPASQGLPVSYCALHYKSPHSPRPAFLTVAWWGSHSLATHMFELAKTHGIKATITFGNLKEKEPDRKVLAEKLHKNVSDIFTPMCIEGDAEYKPMEF